jgi:short-subunit dehydrogenase
MVIPNVGPYASTKSALNALTLTARLELAHDNIHLGLVYPGITATDFMKHAASVHMSNERQHIMQVESPEQVAENIAEAIRTEGAEVSADSLTSRG